MRIPFSIRLISSIVIIELIMLSLLVWNNIRIINQSYSELLTSASRDQSVLLASAIAPGLIAYDYALIDDALSLLKEKHDLVYAEVFDVDLRRIATIGKFPENQPFLLSKNYKEVIEENLLTIERVIKVENQHVGGLRVGYSTIHLKKTINEIRWHNLIISFTTLSALVLATIIISIMLTRKLNKIEFGVNQFQKGNLDFEIKVKKNDELGDLAHTFNHMAKHLSSVQQQLIIEQVELENRVKERTDELQQSNKTLKKTIDELHATQAQLVESEKMASLGGIVSGIAHEINTPLGVSITSVTCIQDDIRQLKDSFHKNKMSEKHFEDYIKNTENCSSLLYNNLKYSAELINSFKQMAVVHSRDDFRNIKVFDYINEIVKSMESTLIKYQISVDNRCSNDLTIYTSLGTLYQIISTLITNSLEHAFDQKQGEQISISAQKHKNNITIEFHDNGKGISDEYKHLIFEPFFTTRRGNKDNSGLGLSIIYNLISRTLKGHIKVQSTQGEGTTFYIDLPRNS